MSTETEADRRFPKDDRCSSSPPQTARAHERIAVPRTARLRLKKRNPRFSAPQGGIGLVLYMYAGRRQIPLYLNSIAELLPFDSNLTPEVGTVSCFL